MKWFLIVTLVVLLILVFTGFGSTHSYFCGIPMMGGPYGMMNYWYGGIIMWIIFLVIIGVIVYFIINREKFIKRERDETPLEILKGRYAKGEITKQEYDKMKNDLES